MSEFRQGDDCPTCHYPTKNGTLRAENAKLLTKLAIAKEALKDIIDPTLKPSTRGNDAHSSIIGYAETINALRAKARIALSKLNEGDEKKEKVK